MFARSRCRAHQAFPWIAATFWLYVASSCLGASPPAALPGSAIHWSGLPGTDNALHGMEELQQYDVVVVAITCNHCPIAIEYYERMKAFVASQATQDHPAVLIAISVSDLPTDQLPRMREMAERQQFNFAYLQDASQQVARQLDARVTPEFFVLDRDRVVRYRGPWDDNLNATNVQTHYVADAVRALLANQPIAVPEVRAKGCAIIYGSNGKTTTTSAP